MRAAPAAEPPSHPAQIATAGASGGRAWVFPDENAVPWLEQVRGCAARCAALCMLRLLSMLCMLC